ncbi:MAG: response regulator [Spirochaetales bacterium]|nr:MAG: response regulator [Spirochaetales bacterium]
MKKILVIDESQLFRDYLLKKLEENSFHAAAAINGLDGILKLRSEIPDLVIMDNYLSRKSSLEVLRELKANPNTVNAPVIMVSSKMDKSLVLELTKFNVKKFFAKPIKIDSLMKAISEILHVNVDIDSTPCIIEAHFNDDILFIEIARGLNNEKIDLLKYKIAELIELYQVKLPKILVMMSNIEFRETDKEKLSYLFTTIFEKSNTKQKFVKILTNANFVTNFISSSRDFKDISVASNLNEAMDDLIGLKPDNYAHDKIVHEKLLKTSVPKNDREENIQMRFDAELLDASAEKLESLGKNIHLAIVDDDIVIQELVKTVFSEVGWKISIYENGRKFVDNIAANTFDLVFLDLMMPEMNGFQVMQYCQERGLDFPIIVFSALSRKETVVKAVGFGIHSYLIKPLKPETLMQKALEILKRNF